MLVPADMIGPQSKLLFQVNKFYGERVHTRKLGISKTIREVCKVVQDVLKEVEVQEPRFISSLTEINGRYEGLDVIGPNEYEVVLYLNQMGVFNFVDDGSLPGCAVLKLSDGRKRSMSLWVEFITASGYLSARKIRSRFQTLGTFMIIHIFEKRFSKLQKYCLFFTIVQLISFNFSCSSLRQIYL